MSYDLIVFDSKGLDEITGDSGDKLNDSVNKWLSENEQPYDAPEPTPTPNIKEFLVAIEGDYHSAGVDFNGRYCIINRPNCGDSGWENTIMIYSGCAAENNLILIDPQGNQPIMTSPNGVGLLDI